DQDGDSLSVAIGQHIVGGDSPGGVRHAGLVRKADLGRLDHVARQRIPGHRAHLIRLSGTSLDRDATSTPAACGAHRKTSLAFRANVTATDQLMSNSDTMAVTAVSTGRRSRS